MNQTTTATNSNEIEFIGIYEGNQNKIEYVDKGISLDDYKLDENAVVGGVVWKPVVGLEECYEVNNYGLVRSLFKKNYHKILKPAINLHGYFRYRLCNKEWKKFTYTAHQMVAQAFLRKREYDTQIDHLNGDKLDNRVENLRWCTCKENANNPITHKRQQDALAEYRKTEGYKESRRKARKKATILKGLHVVCIETQKWYVSARDAERELGSFSANIIRMCNQYKNKGFQFKKAIYKGKPLYHFRYATPEENEINLPKYREALLKSLEE